MELSAEHLDDILVITVQSDRIDAGSAIRFKDRLKEMASGGPGRVILNLEQVGFIDSSGLGAVVAAMKQLGAGQKLELAGLTTAVQKVFRLTRMDTVFVIHPAVSKIARSMPKAS